MQKKKILVGGESWTSFTDACQRVRYVYDECL